MTIEQLKIVLLFICTVTAAVFAYAAYYYRYRTARVYNWDRNRFVDLGSTKITRQEGMLCIVIPERMVMKSYTTKYRFAVTKAFLKKNRYLPIRIYADGSMRLAVVEEGINILIPN